MSVENVRFVTVKGVRYLRDEDVSALINDVGATEPTDTRTRLEELARNILKPVPAAPGPATGAAA